MTSTENPQASSCFRVFEPHKVIASLDPISEAVPGSGGARD